MLPPHRIDEAPAGDGLVCVEDEHRQHGALLRAAERD